MRRVRATRVRPAAVFDSEEGGKPQQGCATSLLKDNGLALAVLIVLAFVLGMIFLVLCGVGPSADPPSYVPVKCEVAEPQSPRDLTTNASGLMPARATPLTAAQAAKLPQTNVFFTLGAEHRSDAYNNGQDSASYAAAYGPKPIDPGLGLERKPNKDPVRPGWMCPSGGYTSEQLADTYEWQCCQGEMHVGKSYEVHYMHSSAGTGTMFDGSPGSRPELSDGLTAAMQGRGIQNPMVVARAMVYHIVNDEADQYTFDDLVHGWDLPGKGNNGSRVMYPGSTTGNYFDNTVCSPYTVTWHVDTACYPVSAPSFDRMCCMMRDIHGLQADLAPHDARELVDPRWVVPASEVWPLA